MTTPMAAWPADNPATDQLMALMRFQVQGANRVPDHTLRDIAATALTFAYRGAAADPGDPLMSPSEAEWLRRLLDLPEEARLDAVRQVQERCSIGQRCFEANHENRLASLHAKLNKLADVFGGTT